MVSNNYFYIIIIIICLLTIMRFQVFLSNTNKFFKIILFQVTKIDYPG